MPANISDAAARVFAAAFYLALGFGQSVKNAFDQGCAAILLENPVPAALPRLHTRKGVDAAEVFFVAPKFADGLALNTL